LKLLGYTLLLLKSALSLYSSTIWRGSLLCPYSSVTGIFMNKRMVAKHGFRLQKLERLIMVRNVNGTNNSEGAITHQVKANIYYKGYVERMRMDVCNLGKTEVILGIP